MRLTPLRPDGNQQSLNDSCNRRCKQCTPIPKSSAPATRAARETTGCSPIALPTIRGPTTSPSIICTPTKSASTITAISQPCVKAEQYTDRTRDQRSYNRNKTLRQTLLHLVKGRKVHAEWSYLRQPAHQSKSRAAIDHEYIHRQFVAMY